MRSDHLAKHTKTHENKAKKLIAKKGEKSEKAKGMIPSQADDRTTHVPAIKQEKIDDEDLKAAVFSNTTNYTDTPKFVLDNYHEASQSNSLPGQPNKTSLEDYYQTYHPYQYQSNMYASNYFHQNSRFYQDKNYFYGHESRGMFPTAASQPANLSSSTQQVLESPLNSHQNEFYHQTSNFQAPSSSLANHSSLPYNTSNNYQQ